MCYKDREYRTLNLKVLVLLVYKFGDGHRHEEHERVPVAGNLQRVDVVPYDLDEGGHPGARDAANDDQDVGDKRHSGEDLEVSRPILLFILASSRLKLEELVT